MVKVNFLQPSLVKFWFDPFPATTAKKIKYLKIRRKGKPSRLVIHN